MDEYISFEQVPFGSDDFANNPGITLSLHVTAGYFGLHGWDAYTGIE